MMPGEVVFTSAGIFIEIPELELAIGAFTPIEALYVLQFILICTRVNLRSTKC